MKTALLSTAYFGPIEYYARLFSYEQVLIDPYEHYLKQTYRNRCIIAAPDGRQPLTVPIERRDASHTPIGQILLSSHNDWRHRHLHALRTAYDGSPYYQYYIDDISDVLFRPFTHLFELNEALRVTIQDMIGLKPRVELTTQYFPPDATAQSGFDDYRQRISPKTHSVETGLKPIKYHQVFEQTLGFLPGLSILDLLFNQGPESILYLRDLTS